MRPWKGTYGLQWLSVARGLMTVQKKLRKKLQRCSDTERSHKQTARSGMKTNFPEVILTWAQCRTQENGTEMTAGGLLHRPNISLMFHHSRFREMLDKPTVVPSYPSRRTVTAYVGILVQPVTILF